MATDPNAIRPENRYSFDRVVRLIITVVTIIAIYWLVRFLSDVLLPFVAGILLAYLINPIVIRLEKRIPNRTASVLITVAGCVGIVILGVAILIPIISHEVTEFGQLITHFRSGSTTMPTAQSLRIALDSYIAEQENPTYRGLLQQLRQDLVETDFNAMVLEGLRRVAPTVWGVLSGVANVLLGTGVLLIVLLYTIFLLIDYSRWATTWPEFLPAKHRTNIVGFVEEFAEAMSVYFRGQFLVATSVGVLFAFGFWLIGLRMGILLGLFIGALNMIPYLQTVGLVPALLLGVVRGVETGSGVTWSVILVLLVFGLVQAVQDGLLVPTIMGRKTGLRPAILFLGVFVWGKLLGFLGLIIAIPMTCLGLAWYRRFVLGQSGARAIGPDRPRTKAATPTDATAPTSESTAETESQPPTTSQNETHTKPKDDPAKPSADDTESQDPQDDTPKSA